MDKKFSELKKNNKKVEIKKEPEKVVLKRKNKNRQAIEQVIYYMITNDWVISDVEKEVSFVKERKAFMSLFVDKLETGDLPLRVTHNDTKINNILFDQKTGAPAAVIDLDTVMPGSYLYDFGDAIRSGATHAAEDEQDLSKVDFDLSLFEQFTKGYLEACGDSLTHMEIKMLPYASIMLTLECGMRFLTDHLNGDTYFKVHRENHNLDRARTQFKLVKEMEDHIEEMTTIINKYVK